ncbi:hypothetical protein PAMA_005555 [Pampus argenteus]
MNSISRNRRPVKLRDTPPLASVYVCVCVVADEMPGVSAGAELMSLTSVNRDIESMKKITGGVFSLARHLEHGPMSERPSSPLNVNCPMIWQENEPVCERPLSRGDTNPSTTQKEQRQRSESPSPSVDDMLTIYLEDSTVDTNADRERQEGDEKESLNPEEKSKQKADRTLSPENLDCPMIWQEHGPAGERPLSRGDTNPSTTQKVQRQKSESSSPSEGDMPTIYLEEQEENDSEMEERRRGKIPLAWAWVNEEREIQEMKGQETEEVEEQSETKREKKERVRQEKDQRKREKKEVKEKLKKLKEEQKRQKKAEKETRKSERMEMKGVKKEDKKVESQEREGQREEETQSRAPTGDLLSRLDTWLNNYMRKNVTHHINRTYERQWLTQLNSKFIYIV